MGQMLNWAKFTLGTAEKNRGKNQLYTPDVLPVVTGGQESVESKAQFLLQDSFLPALFPEVA